MQRGTKTGPRGRRAFASVLKWVGEGGVLLWMPLAPCYIAGQTGIDKFTATKIDMTHTCGDVCWQLAVRLVTILP